MLPVTLYQFGGNHGDIAVQHGKVCWQLLWFHSSFHRCIRRCLCALQCYWCIQLIWYSVLLGLWRWPLSTAINPRVVLAQCYCKFSHIGCISFFFFFFNFQISISLGHACSYSHIFCCKVDGKLCNWNEAIMREFTQPLGFSICRQNHQGLPCDWQMSKLWNSFVSYP